MNANKFLDRGGLVTVWAKMKNWVKSHQGITDASGTVGNGSVIADAGAKIIIAANGQNDQQSVEVIALSSVRQSSTADGSHTDIASIPNWAGIKSYVSATTESNYTAAEKQKLAGIQEGAEVNVQANWNETNSSSDAYIQNKPSIPTAYTSSPEMDGVASAGNSTQWARGNHVHPSDNSKSDKQAQSIVALEGNPNDTDAEVTGYEITIDGLSGQGYAASANVLSIECVTSTPTNNPTTTVPTWDGVQDYVASAIGNKIGYQVVSSYSALPAQPIEGYIYLVPGTDYSEVVNPESGANPKNMNWYERSGTDPNYTYTVTTDTTVQSGKTYYKLGYDEYVWVDSIHGYQLLGPSAIDLGAITTAEINAICV